jgi:hypothetical protein
MQEYKDVSILLGPSVCDEEAKSISDNQTVLMINVQSNEQTDESIRQNKYSMKFIYIMIHSQKMHLQHAERINWSWATNVKHTVPAEVRPTCVHENMTFNRLPLAKLYALDDKTDIKAHV